MNSRGQSRRLRNSASILAFAVGLGVALAVAIPISAAAVSYHAPKLKKPVIKKPGPKVRVFVEADQITIDSKTRVGIATGLVKIEYGPYTLTATRVVYDEIHNTFKANGSVVIREPKGNVVEADSATVWNHFKEGFAHHLRALLTNDVTITAQYSRKYANGVIVYQHAVYTACKHCVDAEHKPVWELDAKTATHNTNNQTIYYDDAVFRIAGVPIVYMPRFAYPDPTVKRRTGFLWANAKYDSHFGFGLITPFFWNLAPNYDLTFSPMLTSKNGLLGDVAWRHKLRSGSYNVRGYGIYELDSGTNSSANPWRGALRSNGRFRLSPSWDWGWNGTAVSDTGFLRDYDIDHRRIVTNQVYLTGLSGQDYLTTRAINYLSLYKNQVEQLPPQDQLPNVLPYINAEHTFDQPVFGGALRIDTNTYALERQKADTTYDLGTQQARSVTTLSWQRQMIAGLGTVLTPFANVRGVVTYAKNVPGSSETESVSAQVLPTAGVDMRLPLVSNFDRGSGVLSPVMQLITAPDAPDSSSYGNENAIGFNLDHTNMFLDDRASGSDRFEGGTRAKAGLSYNYFADKGWSARASVGESFQIAGNNGFTAGSGLDGPASDLVGALQLQPWDFITLRYEARAEEDLSRINAQEAAASLTFDRISGSLSYADIAAAPDYGRPDHEQQVWGDASFALNDSWTLFGGLRYDMLHDDFVQKSVGLSYECDCMNAKLTYAENLTSSVNSPIDHVINLSVSFRTLGSSKGGFTF
jgi:LPS-assembly protein